jgi:hypothetical protein
LAPFVLGIIHSENNRKTQIEKTKIEKQSRKKNEIEKKG